MGEYSSCTRHPTSVTVLTIPPLIVLYTYFWISCIVHIDSISLLYCIAIAIKVIIAPAILLELSNLRVAPSQVTKMSLRTPDPLYTHMRRFGHETTPKCVTLFLVSESEICPHWLLNLHLRHFRTFTCSQTGPCSSLSLKPLFFLTVSMAIFLFGVQCVSKTNLMLRHLSWFLSNF